MVDVCADGRSAMRSASGSAFEVSVQLSFRHDLAFVTATLTYSASSVEIANVLVDTGAASTVINADLAAEAGIYVSPDDTLRRLRGVGGHEHVFLRRVDASQSARMESICSTSKSAKWATASRLAGFSAWTLIGSLVVLLPSDAKGGALVIEHHDEKVNCRGSSDQLVLVAFYADCRHEVRPVTSGYRAALTFSSTTPRLLRRVRAKQPPIRSSDGGVQRSMTRVPTHEHAVTKPVVIDVSREVDPASEPSNGLSAAGCRARLRRVSQQADRSIAGRERGWVLP